MNVTDLQQENKHKSFAGSSLYLFAAKLFPAVAAPLAFILYSHSLSPGLYGHYQNFWIQLLLLSAIAATGLPVFVFTYSPPVLRGLYQRLPAAYRRAYPAFVVLMSFVFGALQYYNNELNPWLAILFFIAYVPGTLFEALLLVGKRFQYLLWTNLVFSILFVLAHQLQLSLGYQLDQLVLVLFFLYLVRSIILGFAVAQTYRRITGTTPELPGNWATIRRHWWHMGLNDLVQVAFRWIDKFIISLLLAKEVLALYSNATYDIPFLALFFTAVSSAALLHWADRRQQSAAEQVQVLHYSSRILSSVILPLFCFLVCFSPEILTFLYSSQYQAGLSIFICAQFILPVRAYPFTGILQHFHRGDIINKGAIADLLIACILMYPLYLLLGLKGVALSFVISTYWQAGYYLLQSARLLQQSPLSLVPWTNILSKLVLNGALFGISYLALSATAISPGWKLFCGVILLLLSGGLLLRYEWQKGNRFFS